MLVWLSLGPALRALCLLAIVSIPNIGMAFEQDTSAAPADTTPQRIVVLNWWLAEHLLALGITPIAVAEREGYDQWVGYPRLPTSVKSAGRRQAPNLEAIRALNPDLILVSSHLQAAVPALRKIAPTQVQTTYEADSNPWIKAQENLSALGKLLGREARAEAILDEANESLAATRDRLKQAGLAGQSVYLVRFLDDKRARIHGNNSMLSQALEQVDLKNPWHKKTNLWGFTPGTLADLGNVPAAWMVYIRPWADADRERLQSSALWPYLPMARTNRITGVGPVWTFGGVLSVPRMAGMLADQLIRKTKEPLPQ